MSDATQQSGLSSLPAGAAGMNFYGADPADVQAYRDSLQQATDALAQRYANPNWFNVAAGFLKPQLGGFFASLGSAAQAMGQWQEEQRQNQLPLAAMKAQLAQANIVLGQNQKANQIAQDNGENGVTPEYVAKLAKLAPNAPVTVSASKQLETQMAQQRLFQEQNAADMARAQAEFNSSTDPNARAVLQQRLAEIGNRQQPGAHPTQPPGAITGAGPSTPAQLANAPVVASPAASPTGGIPSIGNWNPSVHDLAVIQHDIAVTSNPHPVINFNGSAQANTPGSPAEPVSSTGVPSAPAGMPGLTAVQQSEQIAANQKAQDDAAHSELTYINMNTPRVTTDALQQTAHLQDLLSDPKVRAGVGLLYGPKGIITMAQNAAAEGASGTVGAPGTGAASFHIDLPVESAIANLTLDPDTRMKLRDLALTAQQLQANNIRQNTQAFGGGHQNQSESSFSLSQIMGRSDPAPLLSQMALKAAVQAERDAKIYDDYNGRYRADPNNVSRPAASYLLDPGYRSILNGYAKKQRQVYKLTYQNPAATP